MKYEVKKLCKDMGDYYEVDPAVMFPATIARIQEVLAGDPPTELVSKGWKGSPYRDPVVDRFMTQAEAIPEGDWKLRTVAVLDLADSWFKRALALSAGKGIRIHVSRDPEYRRVS